MTIRQVGAGTSFASECVQGGYWFSEFKAGEVWVKAGTPTAVQGQGAADSTESIVRRLNAAVFDALKNAELRDAYTRQGNDITPGTPEAFAALIRSDTAKWARVIKSSGVKLDAP